MIDKKKIEEAANECAIKHGDVAPFVKRGFYEGVVWLQEEILKIINEK